MAAALYLVSVAGAQDPCTNLVNGVHALIINADNGHTSAEIIAEAEVVVKAAGHAIPSGYFDTVTALTTVDADHDYLLFLPRGITNGISA